MTNARTELQYRIILDLYGAFGCAHTDFVLLQALAA